jgi:hypothetical protein
VLEGGGTVCGLLFTAWYRRQLWLGGYRVYWLRYVWLPDYSSMKMSFRGCPDVCRWTMEGVNIRGGGVMQ